MPDNNTTTSDARCAHCDYPLKGLPQTGRCPECGAHYSASPRSKGPRDRLGDAPLRYIRLLTVASVVAGIAGTAAFAAFSLSWFTNSLAIAAIGLAGFVGYIAALAVFARPRKRNPAAKPLPVPPHREWLTLKLAGIGGQFGIAIAVLLAVTSHSIRSSRLAQTQSQPPVQAPHPSQHADWLTHTLDAGSVLFIVAFFASFFPLGFLLANYADWADDEELAGKFRSAGWIAGVLGSTSVILGALLNIGLGGALAFFALVASIIFNMFTFFAVAFMPVGLLFFAQTCNWAKRNKDEERDRDARLAARRKQDAEQMVNASALSSPAAFSTQLDGNAHPHPANFHRVHRTPQRHDQPAHASPDNDRFPAPPDPVSPTSDVPDDELNPYTLEDNEDANSNR